MSVWDDIYEVEQGVWKLNYKPKSKKSLTEWFASQGRFSHLLSPMHRELVDTLQQQVDLDWEGLESRCQ